MRRNKGLLSSSECWFLREVLVLCVLILSKQEFQEMVIACINEGLGIADTPLQEFPKFEKLPHDVKFYVLSLLDIATLVKLPGVCKSFQVA
jgi:hypothetical protein